jgi:hypothetical protein
MTGNAVTWNRKVQGLESSGKDRQTGECTYGQEPYGYSRVNWYTPANVMNAVSTLVA